MRSLATLLATLLSCSTAFAKPTAWSKLSVKVTVSEGVLSGTTDGHVQLLITPAGSLPTDDTDVTSSPDYFFGKNVFDFHVGSSVWFPGTTNNDTTDYGVWGFSRASGTAGSISLDDIPAGDYAVQAFMNIYETARRSDGSVISVNFPCGDGAPGILGYGSLTSSVSNVTISSSGAQTIELALSEVTPSEDFTGKEIGGCHQGNYADSGLIKYIKIRSEKLSTFWGRGMYVGATVKVPKSYDASNTSKRYPVIYSQDHWSADAAAFDWTERRFPGFIEGWDAGIRPATNKTPSGPAPDLILVRFRHENPYYDDSYAVNNANLGPWADAINDELIPLLDRTFNTIAEPYARVQEGGSTGGWESISNLIFRPDLFGVTFTYYPDSLDFHRHQAIPLYTNDNAYFFENGGGFIPSIRANYSDVLATTAQENHWELTFGTSSRSQIGQWDVWQAVFGVQGLNSYPLEAWDKVTGEIYPGAVEYWKHMDLGHYVSTNWDNALQLGKVLKNRIFIYVGTWDTYYLNLGVEQFQQRVEAKGGAHWANFTYLAQQPHGGTYEHLNIWDYLDILVSWIDDHAPDGKTPLSASVTPSSSRGNKWEDVLSYGGHQAAVSRQAPPAIKGNKASVGRWDPGVALRAQWLVDGKACGKSFAVEQGQEVTFPGAKKSCSLQIQVTGKKRGYETEKRKSNVVTAAGTKQSNHGWGGWSHGSTACPL